MSDDLIEQLDILHVWPQSVADYHADILTPRQIKQLYDVGRVATEAVAELRTLRAERDDAVQAAELRGVALGIEAAAKWAKDDAKTCDCSAYSESECACGAWCEWKTVPMHRVIDGLSNLNPAAIIAAQGGE